MRIGSHQCRSVPALTLILGSAVAYAHNGVEHVMATIADIQTHRATKFSKNDAPLSRKEVKVGDRVVIDAKATTDKKLLGVTVKLGAMGSADHGEHEK